MKVFYSPYKLLPQNEFSGIHQASRGVLLKFLDEGDRESYSLYHPIESLGDLPLSDFLSSEKKRSVLIEKIKELRLDPGRELKGSVQSYYLASSQDELFENKDQIFKNGFRVVKLKASMLTEIDFKALESLSFDYIFDFNGREKIENFRSLGIDLKFFLKKRLKYIEDPYLQKSKLNFNLASDFIDYEQLSDYKIIKPTGFNRPLLKKKTDTANGQEFVVTSYLDHPLGQLLSAQWACRHKVSSLCGLWTHGLYQKNDYSALFENGGSIDLVLTKDFTTLLEKEDWRPL